MYSYSCGGKLSKEIKSIRYLFNVLAGASVVFNSLKCENQGCMKIPKDRRNAKFGTFYTKS